MPEEVGVGALDRQSCAERFDRLPQIPQSRGEVFGGCSDVGRAPRSGGRRLDGGRQTVERGADPPDTLRRIAGEEAGLRIEEGRPGQPGWHVVLRAPFRLQRVGMEGGHHMEAAAVVVEGFAEGRDPIVDPAEQPADVDRGVVGEGDGPDRLPQGRQPRQDLRGREAGRVPDHFGEALERRVDVRRLPRGELLAERFKGGNELLKRPQEGSSPHRIVGGPEHQLPPGDISLPELLHLGIDPFGPELPSLLHRCGATFVEVDEPLPERLAVGHVGRGRILQPHPPLRRVGEELEAEELSQVLVLGDQKRNILPGGGADEPVEEELVGMPFRQWLFWHNGQLRLLDVADRLDLAAGERVERHDPPIFENGDRPPRGERGGEPRRRRVGARRRGPEQGSGSEPCQKQSAEGGGGSGPGRGHRAPRGRWAGAFSGLPRRGSRRFPGRSADPFSPRPRAAEGGSSSSPSSCRRGRKK